MDKSETMYDRRVIERHMAEGLFNRADLEKHLKALPDSAAKAAEVDTAILAPRGYLKSVMGIDPASLQAGGVAGKG